jgi:protease I
MINKILIPLPSYGFDPTEVAIPWQQLTKGGYQVIFATPNKKPSQCDILMVEGKKLGIWKSVLKARKDAVDMYHQMIESEAFKNPKSYSEINVEDYLGLILPGGHDKGIKEYLESKPLQSTVASFFKKKKPVGAICHGMVLAARSFDTETKKSVIADYKVTALLKSQELLAYQMTKLWLKDYYLTYPKLTVEDEVKSVLNNKKNFQKGPIPLLRDSPKRKERGFVVEDRNFISSRWPGDVYRFSSACIKLFNRAIEKNNN